MSHRTPEEASSELHRNGANESGILNQSFSVGFIRLIRSPATQELLSRDPLAFALLTTIALRARWRIALSMDGLELGEALIGDYEKCGMTRREYRTRVTRLEKLRLISIRPTPKGTVARLTSGIVFDINCPPNECITSRPNAKNRPSGRPTVSPMKNHIERPTKRPRDGQLAANRRPLTNKERTKQGKNAVVAAVAHPVTKTLTLEQQQLFERLRANAAAANNAEDLIETLEPHFPGKDLRRQYSLCYDYYKQKRRPVTSEAFLRWMVRSKDELKPLPKCDASEKNGATRYDQLVRASEQQADAEAKSTE